MKNRQRTIALGTLGLALVAAALWFGRFSKPAAAPPPVAEKSALGANSLRPGGRVGAPIRAATNLAAARGPQAPMAKGRTNPAPTLARPGPQNRQATNGVIAKAGAPGRPGTSAAAVPAPKPSLNVLETLRRWQASPSFYSVLSSTVFGLVLASLLVARFIKSRRAGIVASSAGPLATTRLKGAHRQGATVNSCNVLKVGTEARSVWNFGSRSGKFVLNREQACKPGESLPAGLVARDWRSLFQRKLNIAWLPPEMVFLRVAQFPASDFQETVAMVELQLEKLSPMPVAQIVWSLQILPNPRAGEQTVVVMIIARSLVEEFLGRLEGDGFLADRLDLPVLDQLIATQVEGDGVWIYPAVRGKNTVLAAWWSGGVLRNLDLVVLSPTDRAASLRDQLLQTAWAGEFEGWLVPPPHWRLVADSAEAADWEPVLKAAFDQPIPVTPPLPEARLAGLTATRAAKAEVQANLLPPEFTARYQQQFVDRLWMGLLLAVVGLYIAGVLVYGVAVGFASYRTGKVEDAVAELAPAYTNALMLKDRYAKLKERQDLKYAALDCWKSVAELLPEDVTLDFYNFSEGRRLTLNGTAPVDQNSRLLQFEGAMRKASVDGQPLFDALKGESLSTHLNPGGQTLSWSVAFELKRAEVQ